MTFCTNTFHQFHKCAYFSIFPRIDWIIRCSSFSCTNKIDRNDRERKNRSFQYIDELHIFVIKTGERRRPLLSFYFAIRFHIIVSIDSDADGISRKSRHMSYYHCDRIYRLAMVWRESLLDSSAGGRMVHKALTATSPLYKSSGKFARYFYTETSSCCFWWPKKSKSYEFSYSHWALFALFCFLSQLIGAFLLSIDYWLHSVWNCGFK